MSLLTRADLLPEEDVGFVAFDVYTLDMRPPADLALTKADSPDPVTKGADLTYTLAVQNLGPEAAPGVTLFDRLPAQVQFVSATATQGSCIHSGKGARDGLVTCTVGTIDAFETVTVTITVRPTRAGLTLTNTAFVRAGAPDPDTDNNTATETTLVVQR